jgi:hypothetical protein
VHALTELHRFLLLATDGVWEVPCLPPPCLVVPATVAALQLGPEVRGPRRGWHG